MDWYYAIGDSKQGPVSEEKLMELVEAGFIGADTLVWSADLPAWTPLRAVRELDTAPEPAAEVASGAFDQEFTQAPTPVAVPSPEEDTEPHPWLRWLARIFDMWIFALAFGIGAAIVLEITAPRLSEALFGLDDYVFGLIVLGALIPIEALFLSSHGTTPGKWIFGLRVMPVEGGKPSYTTALKRAALVWWRGLGLGLPIVMLVTQAHAHSKLKSTGQATWDRDMDQVVLHRPMSGPHVALAVGLGIVLLVIYAFLNAYGASGY
jgi:uncharacterized RDD family membrane protein YckC